MGRRRWVGSGRKGAYLMVEYMLIVTMGMFLLAGFLFIFSSFKDDTARKATDAQERMVGHIVQAGLFHLTMSGDEGTIVLPLPEKIAEAPYALELKNGQVFVHGLSSVLGLQAIVTDNFKLKGTLAGKRLVPQLHLRRTNANRWEVTLRDGGT